MDAIKQQSALKLESTQQEFIPSDWTRPSVTPCSPELRSTILSETKDEVYVPVNSGQRKGLSLIITNINFADPKYNRNGAEKDEENMEWLLKGLGYTVEKYRDLTGEQIQSKLQEFSKRPEHKDSDSTFVVIMSHGTRIDNKDAILGTNYGKNSRDYHFVEETFKHLNSENCPALINKPKVILIQACRGDQGGSVPSNKISEAFRVPKDFVCFMSSLPGESSGTSANRIPKIGSFFICYIVDVFCKFACKAHILDLFMKVTSLMADDKRFPKEIKLLPCIEKTTLVKKFFLFPEHR